MNVDVIFFVFAMNTTHALLASFVVLLCVFEIRASYQVGLGIWDVTGKLGVCGASKANWN